MDDDFHGVGGPADCWEVGGYGPSPAGETTARRDYLFPKPGE